MFYVQYAHARVCSILNKSLCRARLRPAATRQVLSTRWRCWAFGPEADGRAGGRMTAEKGRRSGFFVGVIVFWLLRALASHALGVALYITKPPSPFVDKTPQRTPSRTRQGRAQQELGPQRPVGRQGKSRQRPAGGGSGGNADAHGVGPCPPRWTPRNARPAKPEAKADSRPKPGAASAAPADPSQQRPRSAVQAGAMCTVSPKTPSQRPARAAGLHRQGAGARAASRTVYLRAHPALRHAAAGETQETRSKLPASKANLVRVQR